MKTPTHKLWTVQDADRQWRWHVKARNGKSVAEGAEGYKRAGTMQRSLANIVKAILAGTMACALLLASGCAVNRQRVQRTTFETNGVKVVEYTRSTLYTVFDGKNTADKIKVSQSSKTQSIGQSNTEQVSSGTNVVKALESIERILEKVK